MSKTIKIGSFPKPTIKHDHGFLDDGKGNIDISKKRRPTAEDFWEFAKWVAKLEAAESVRFDLMDACAAYKHFLFGNGSTRKLNYNSFIQNDKSGKEILQQLIKDFRKVALTHTSTLFNVNSSPTDRSTQFEMYSEPIGVGGSNFFYPYPDTENWQKAIGAHVIYSKANVDANIPKMSKNVSLSFDITIYVEDMYNFNPKNKDIKTHIPDDANGRFELCGLAKEYLNLAEINRLYKCDVQLDDLSTPLFATITNESIEINRK